MISAIEMQENGAQRDRRECGTHRLNATPIEQKGFTLFADVPVRREGRSSRLNARDIQQKDVSNEKGFALKNGGGPHLSAREKEVLILIAYEYTTNRIADKLYVSHHTILSHRKNIMRKLEVTNVAGIVRRGFEIGVLKVEELAGQTR